MAKKSRGRDPFVSSQQTPIATVTGQELAGLVYDYSQIPEAHRDAIKRSAINIKPRLKRAAEDIFVIGEELAATKARLLHGEYTNWLEVEFGLSERMAQRFVNVRERLGAKSDKLSVLIPSALYLLAAKSTPDEAIEAVEKAIDAGNRIGVAYVQSVVTKYKQRRQQPTIVIEGEVISSETVEEDEIELTAAARRLEQVLTTAFEILEGQPDDDWGQLFRNSELGRVRNEIHKLRELVQNKLASE